MRYYLVTVQYNKNAEAENRTVPKAFNTLDDAIAEFHTQMGKDMKNESLGWALSIIFDSMVASFVTRSGLEWLSQSWKKNSYKGDKGWLE